MPTLPIALAIFAGLFAFSWVVTCIANARYDRARDDAWAAFNGRPRCGTGAASKRRRAAWFSKSLHGGGGYTS